MSQRAPGSSTRLLAAANSVSVFDLARARVLARVLERLDPAKTRWAAEPRPAARPLVEQMVDTDYPRMPKADRDRLVDEVVGEVFGFGPLEELFRDAGVKEVLVLDAQIVVVRRDTGWVPTNVKFQDEEHLRRVLDRVAMQAVPVAGGLPSSAVDGALPNGFRAVLVVPPPVLGRPATAVFVRGGLSAAAAAGSGAVGVPAARPAPAEPAPPNEHQLARFRLKITERILSKLTGIGVSDLSRVDKSELRRVVAAYVAEFCGEERIPLTDALRDKLITDILAGLSR